jgi:hypothetical protein
MRQVFQMMLAYWVWLKKETYWVRGDVLSREGARTAIIEIIHVLVSKPSFCKDLTSSFSKQQAKFQQSSGETCLVLANLRTV